MRLTTIIILAATGTPMGALLTGSMAPTTQNCVAAIGAVVIGIIASFVMDAVQEA